MKPYASRVLAVLALLVLMAAECHRTPLPPEPTGVDVELNHFSGVPAEGTTVSLSLTFSEDWVATVEDGDWCTLSAVSGAPGSVVISIKISANPGSTERSCRIIFTTEASAASFKISQNPYKQLSGDAQSGTDGRVTVLQEASEGAGIPIVIIGDAFSQEDIDSGLWSNAANDAAEAFFGIEPFKSCRHLFDIYSVDVVSPHFNCYSDYFTGTSTTLGTLFGDDAFIEGNHVACRTYALKAVDKSALDNTLVIVLVNRKIHAGRCYMQFVDPDSEESCDCAHGVAYAYCALGLGGEDFAYLIRHEAGGHGFGRLADEYSNSGSGEIPEATAEIYRSMQERHHAYMNVDFSGEAASAPWSEFLCDERYAAENLGLWEGACNYSGGVWRPSRQSLMSGGAGSFNAPSREAIWRRIHCLAYGPQWHFDREEFVAWDAPNIAAFAAGDDDSGSGEEILTD